MYYHEDDRAQRLFDVFDVLDGQINVSYVNSTEHIVAWHKHKKFFLCQMVHRVLILQELNYHQVQ